MYIPNFGPLCDLEDVCDNFGMSIEITRAALAEKAILQRLMELYLYDFTEFDGADLDAEGVYGYPYMDQYWIEAERVPFLIRVDGMLAGFALVCEHSWMGNPGKMIAEFFVLRKYRGRGVGRTAAFTVFDSFPGHWEVSQVAQNIPAQKFWRKVIGEYTRENYREVMLDNEDWQGPVQVFNNTWAADRQEPR